MDHKKTVKKYVYERDNRKCRFCRKELLFHQISLDHYLPKSEKGPNDVFNIVLSCKKCNKLKENKIPSDYESVLLTNFKRGVSDKKITSSVVKLKHLELQEISETIDRIESINAHTVFQGEKYRIYIKNDIVNRIVNLG